MNTGKLVDFKLDYCLDVDFKQSEAVSMLLADRIRQLRQEHRWTQAELGQKIKIHQKQISSYERGVNIPSTEVLIKMADIFDVTLDYLAFEEKGSPGKVNIQDRELLRRFEQVDRLPDHEKNLAKEVLDLIILKTKFRELVGTNQNS